MENINSLSDDELLSNLISLNSNEVRVVADVLLHLIEIGKRRLYARQGYSSLFSYCVGALNYCDGTAGRRIIAARAVEKFPLLLNYFLEQKITLTTIVLISKILTKENQKSVLTAVSKKGKVEVERYVASYLPEKSIREGVRALPSLPKNELPCLPSTQASLNPIKESSNTEQPNNSASGVGNSLKLNEKVNNEVNFEIKIKANDSTVKKLRRVQELRGKKESLGELFELLLDEFIEKHSPEARIARRERRESRVPIKITEDDLNQLPQIQSRYIPQTVKDRLYTEYNGQCAYLAPDGNRCNCRKGLQVDHIYPYGLGGSNDIGNLRLLCTTHNYLAAENVYGVEKMKAAAGNSRNQGELR